MVRNYLLASLIIVFILFILINHNTVDSEVTADLIYDNSIINPMLDMKDKSQYFKIDYNNEIHNNNRWYDQYYELDGICKFNKYLSNTLPIKLKKYLEYHINNLFYQRISIIEFIDINEQIDIHMNRRYIVTLFININKSFSSKKIYLDFIITNNNRLYVNNLSNVNNNTFILDYPKLNVEVYNRPIDVTNTNSGNSIDSIQQINKQIDLSTFENCNNYINDNRFCYKDSINWDSNGINYQTTNTCSFNNNGSYEVPYNRTNYPNDYTMNK